MTPTTLGSDNETFNKSLSIIQDPPTKISPPNGSVLYPFTLKALFCRLLSEQLEPKGLLNEYLLSFFKTCSLGLRRKLLCFFNEVIKTLITPLCYVRSSFNCFTQEEHEESYQGHRCLQTNQVE